VSAARETSLTLTVLGAAAPARLLKRDAARPGDRLFVTGTFGGAALAVTRARRFDTPVRHLPSLRLAAGRALGRLAARGACIDVSDGLLADLGHVLEASGVGARVEVDRIPRPRGFAAACARIGQSPEALVLGGGEDYELLFTLRHGGPGPAVLARRLGAPVAEIGRIERARGLRLGGGGRALAALRRASAGWRHF
jgi:thiamine-monophosphate kinase